MKRLIMVLRGDLDTTNKYKDKFKAISAELDELLKDQRCKRDTRSLGFEHGESSGTPNENEATGQKDK